MIYQITNWNEHYENDRSRTREKCSFVCIPNKQDGMGLSKILSLLDGASILGIFLLVCEACSRQPLPRDGFLTDDGTITGRPWTIKDMALLWRRKEKEIERAFSVITMGDIAWVAVIKEGEARECTGSARGVSHPELNRIEEKGIEEKRREVNNNARPRTWRNSYWFYLHEVILAYRGLISDSEKIIELERLNPGIAVKLSLEKSVFTFWGTKAGWKCKCKKRSVVDIDMRMTLIRNMDKNRVWSRDAPEDHSDKMARMFENFDKREARKVA